MMTLPIVVIAVIVLAVIINFKDKIATWMPGTTFPKKGGLIVGGGVAVGLVLTASILLPFSTSLFIGIILFLSAFFVPEKPWKWLEGTLAGIGVLVILVAVANSGFGLAAKRSIERAENCAAVGDCGPSLDDIPTYSDRTVVSVAAGQTRVFYAKGKITLRNTADCHRLIVSPPGVFNITWNESAILIFIEAKSGDTEYASVRSERDNSDRACFGYWDN